MKSYMTQPVSLVKYSETMICDTNKMRKSLFPTMNLFAMLTKADLCHIFKTEQQHVLEREK